MKDIEQKNVKKEDYDAVKKLTSEIRYKEKELLEAYEKELLEDFADRLIKE